MIDWEISFLQKKKTFNIKQKILIKSITGDREFQEKLFNISIAMLTATYHMKMRGASQNNLIKEKKMIYDDADMMMVDWGARNM